MSALLENMRAIFSDAQYNKGNHPQCLSKMTKLFKQADEKEFAKRFIDCLAVPLSFEDKHPKVENTLDFAAKFSMGVYSFNNEGADEEMCPFWNELFDFLLTNHDVEDRAIRFRIVFFLNMLLNSMGENAFLDDTLFDRISTNMMERLLDKVPKIRAQAVFALHRFQDPNDDDCPVMKTLIFHLCKDPQSEVRRAVLLVLGKNKQTLAVVLRRTRDINEGVRKLAYQFLSRITVKSLKIEQRDQLLSDGLRDRSEKVSEYVKTQLLPTWLDHYEGEYIKLLRALDAEKAFEISTLALEVLFKTATLRNIIAQVPVDEETKLIPLDKLSCESVIYWRCVVEHLHREGCEEKVEEILPDLSIFCKYIRNFSKFMKEGNREDWENDTLKFVLVQLFQITKTYDFGDEFGRENLEKLIFNILESDINYESLIDCIVQQLVAVVSREDVRLTLLVDVINNMRNPQTTVEVVPLTEAEKHEQEMKKARFTVDLLQAEEEYYQAIQEKDFLKADSLHKRIQILKGIISELSKDTVLQESEEELEADLVMKNDEETLTKCLQIMVSMMQSAKTLSPQARSLLEHMVLPSLDHVADTVTILALKATTLCCLLDINLAKMHIPLFFVQFGVENNELWLTSLKCMFDLLVQYGLEKLGMVTNSEADDCDSEINSRDRSRKDNKQKNKRIHKLFSNTGSRDFPDSPPPIADNSNKNIINILTKLLDNVNQDLRTIAAEGLCKLLFHRRISSPSLLARLIILWYNPVTQDDVYLRQCLSYFFNNFPDVVSGGQEMLERCFLPTLKVLAKAPSTSPLREIEPLKVARLIIHLSNIEVKNRPLAYNPHNNLAFAIIAEALNTDSDIDPAVLVRSLRYLNVVLEDESTRKYLQEGVEKLLTSIEHSDKRCINSVTKFRSTLYNQPSEFQQNEEPNFEEDNDDPEMDFE